MIKKIISGGQTGADRAALDVAIELGIPHGGWIPKGRITENGPLPNTYNLKEMPSASYQDRTEQNVKDSHGTLIMSHGSLTGGSKYTLEMTRKHNTPCLHIDLNKTTAFNAAVKINGWIYGYKMEILNVAGPRASKDPKIYQAVKDILGATFNLMTIDENMSKQDMANADLPKTVEKAVEHLIPAMSLKDKTIIAHMEEDELSILHATLGSYIRNEFGLWDGNYDLIKVHLV